MPDFSRIITMAYMRILGRPPDPGGLENYDRLMNGGMTEAMMRESLLRSGEYANKHPDRTLATATASAAPASRKKTTRKKRSTKKKAASTKKARRSPRR